VGPQCRSRRCPLCEPADGPTTMQSQSGLHAWDGHRGVSPSLSLPLWRILILKRIRLGCDGLSPVCVVDREIRVSKVLVSICVVSLGFRFASRIIYCFSRRIRTFGRLVLALASDTGTLPGLGL
jgi:hypothetical protein